MTPLQILRAMRQRYIKAGKLIEAKAIQNAIEAIK